MSDKGLGYHDIVLYNDIVLLLFRWTSQELIVLDEIMVSIAGSDLRGHRKGQTSSRQSSQYMLVMRIMSRDAG